MSLSRQYRRLWNDAATPNPSSLTMSEASVPDDLAGSPHRPLAIPNGPTPSAQKLGQSSQD